MDLSQSKMPPQQGDGLLDVFDAALGFRAHGRDIEHFPEKCEKFPMKFSGKWTGPDSCP
jgi:hypothetical protein